MGRKKREVYEEFLKGIEVFAAMDPYEVVKMIDASKVAEFPAGEQIIAQVVDVIKCREMKDISSIY